MCGIYLCLKHGEEPSVTTQNVKDLLQHRGPDAQHEYVASLSLAQCDGPVKLESTQDNLIQITCFSSVLSLRGDTVVAQPLINGPDSRNLHQTSFLCWNGEAWSFGGTPIRGNDSAHVFHSLCHVAASSHASGRSPDYAISEALASYAGPFAFAFFDHLSSRLYCGRDFLGRRSLLYKTGEDGELLLCSVPDNKDGWFEIEADGIYCVDVAAGLHLHKISHQQCSDDKENRRYHTSVPLQLENTINGQEATPNHAALTTTSDSVRTLHRLLTQSLRTRLRSIPHPRVVPSAAAPPPARLAVLYSGGIDCTLLARLSHDVLDSNEPIDLLNVAFENPRSHAKAIAAGRSPFEECPDRKTAESSLAQLRLTCPTRTWRLVKVNVPYTEFVEHRERIINLIYPHDTEMDLSIASALYFASRGRGVLGDGTSFETSARVLLSGLGADELFAGYSRHDAAFTRNGFVGLHDELALDMSRLGKRNLGRDDRVISHWAKEARFPFLDEHLVRWAIAAPLWQKCGFGLPTCYDTDGQAMDPAKLVLRCLALRLGLGSASNEKKRAIQFGARTAKMETGKTKGTHSLTAAAA